MQAFALKNKKSSHRYFKDNFNHHLSQNQARQGKASSPDKVNIKLIDLNEIKPDNEKSASGKFNKTFQLNQKSFTKERKTQIKFTKIINCSLNRKKFIDSTNGIEKIRNFSEECKDLIESAKHKIRRELVENLKKLEKEEKNFSGLLVMPNKDKYVKFKKYLVTDHASLNKSWRTSQKIKNLACAHSYETECSTSPKGKAGLMTPTIKSANQKLS